MKSLISLVLTTAICLSFAGILCAEDAQGRILSSEELSLSAKKSTSIEEKIYWKRSIENLLSSKVPFAFDDKGAAELTRVMKYYEVYDKRSEFVVPFRMNIDVKELSPRPLKVDKKEQWATMKAKWGTEFFSASSYISAGTNAEKSSDDVPLVVGVEGESSIFDLGLLGKVNYVSNLNNLSPDSRVDFHVKSEYSFGDSWNSNLELSWNVFGESQSLIAPSASLAAEDEGDYKVYAADIENLSVANAKVKCYPFRNLKLSLNYYYYAQNKARMSHTSPSRYLGNDTFWANYTTNGSEKELGSEINFSADFFTDSGIYSTLLAGWYTPGDAYAESPSDENVFEIRGEIVVSF
ncbi:MAG: hypothetical protein JW928_07110 [Candidatus Aureabacteria bacterium]|nr:hypothetical protein [Candidatus Auribacterota bacterium]